MSVADVYVPVVVPIDTATGKLASMPYVDFEGAPWMYVGEEDNVWMETDDDEEEMVWQSRPDIEETALEALSNVLALAKSVKDWRKDWDDEE